MMTETPDIDGGSSGTQSPSIQHNEATDQSTLERHIHELVELFSKSFEQTERVAAVCAEVGQLLGQCRARLDGENLQQFLSLLRGRGGPMLRPVFELLATVAAGRVDPWPVLTGMLNATDRDLVGESLNLVLQSAQSGSLVVDRRIVAELADRLERDDSPIGQSQYLQTVLDILSHLKPAGASGGCEGLLRDMYTSSETMAERSLAARLLDLEFGPVPADLARAILGEDSHRILAPYLAYTRATHLDVLHLVSAPNLATTTVPSLQRARTVCGEVLLRKVIAELGWSRVNLGLEVQRYLGCSVDGSLPLMVSPSEASLIIAGNNVRRTRDYFVFVAHGCQPHRSSADQGVDEAVARFRDTNLTHAELLTLILDLAPLTREKVQSILDRLDKIVGDFTTLFSAHSEECAILPGLYRELRERVVAELEREASRPQLSPELSRLVQMFEDPRTLGEVHTLHGLKRYLHQRGLKLGFQLVGRSLATNRTVDLVLASRRRLLATVKRIRYIDFEVDCDIGGNSTHIPYPVSVISEGFARQLLYGQESFPQVDTYCYGNEVHYYLSFGNHPAFLRIDYSPPLRGGMIDLEYYGVSKNELVGHPDISLRAISLFFRRLEFDVQVDNTHIRARYDKERALNLGEVCRKAEAIFRLAPYMMDIDWIIGSLSLSPTARQAVADAWSESFVRWGVLPLRDLLTEDKTGIQMTLQTPVGSDAEITWSGRGAYADRFSMPLAEDFHTRILKQLEKVGLEFLWPLELGESRLVGQMDLEHLFLEPLREALARGEVIEISGKLQAQPAEFFQREHEAKRFARMLDSHADILGSSQLAELVAPLERTLRFHTTGSINEYEVQQGRLALRGESISIYLLRDSRGVIRLALFARDLTLCLRRPTRDGEWRSNANCNPTELATLLLRNNYLAAGVGAETTNADESRRAIAADFRTMNPARRRCSLPGERLIGGLRASPGRAVGRVVLGIGDRTPEDCAGAVLIAATVGPQDTPLLHQCAGVVSTGGGILSHTGLIAAQFRKPALIIQGQWQDGADGSQTLLYRITEHSEEEKTIGDYAVTMYRHLREREYRLSDGDLVVLDADEGTLGVLGQERTTLALFEGIKRFGEASRQLEQAQEPRVILVLRGQLLQAQHLIERLITRLNDPSLAHYTLYELLLGDDFSRASDEANERPRLLRLLLANAQIGATVREHLVEIAGDLRSRSLIAYEKAMSCIPTAGSLYEILLRRIQALRLARTCENIRVALSECQIPVTLESSGDPAEIDDVAWWCVTALRDRLLQKVIAASDESPTLRHLIRQFERLDLVLGLSNEVQAECWRRGTTLRREDRRTRQELEHRFTLTSTDGGFELSSFIGMKGANLAETERLVGQGIVPSWFVVTDHAFREMLEVPLGQSLIESDPSLRPNSTLRDAIGSIISIAGEDYEDKSRRIQRLWRRVGLPAPLKKEISDACETILARPSVTSQPTADNDPPFVAIRSSSREEDAEAAARAGEFDTFLFIRGTEAILEYVRRAWGGLWTARAIQNRALLAVNPTEPGGGVIVQRMVRSRVSGVLHTVNMVSGEPGEIVINAGLGLGEGVVSGTVPADQIVVAKEGVLEGLPVRFRYTTADKKEQVVFDARSGLGTQRVESLYHQRFRAALEYVELCELVRTAVQLEAAYGYPLDIEFGIEGTKLWILQARPVPTYMTVLQETLEHWPLVSPTAQRPGGGRRR